jgi:hypothetical protein
VVEVLLTQPLWIVVGSEAGSKRMRDDLLTRRRQDKPVHVLQGSNHMKLYDVPKSSGRGGHVVAKRQDHGHSASPRARGNRDSTTI